MLLTQFNVRVAKGKHIEVSGAKQSNFILHNRLKLMACKSYQLILQK